MTVKELAQLYWLNMNIPHEIQHITELEAKAATPSAPMYTGMPGGSSGYKVSRLEEKIMKVTERQEQLEQMIAERDRLQQFIDDIPDVFTRYIFTLRFVDNLTWKEIACRAGGRNTDESVKKRCYRYLKGSDEDGENTGTATEV